MKAKHIPRIDLHDRMELKTPCNIGLLAHVWAGR